MSIHCRPYRYDIRRILAAVSAILLGFMYASGSTRTLHASKPRIAILGDSMTWIGGDSCQNETGWTHTLKESGLAGAIDIYARSGATWTNTSTTKRNPDYYTEILHDDNVVFNQAVRLIERADSTDTVPDIIILFAGANDAWFASKRPGVFDIPTPTNNYSSTQPSDFTTLSGSIELVCRLLESRFPDAVFLFVSPIQMSKTDADRIHRTSEIIESTANARGWKTLRADEETAITHEQESISPTFTYDGVHTNPAGAKILGNYIIRYLQNQTTPQLHN